MSLLNTDPIWMALGDFYELFPDDERVYWTTFWEAYGDIIADLWGLAYQVDRAKSLFNTTATFERREVLVKLSNLVTDTEAKFVISSLKQDSAGRWVLRGFVKRDLRTFRAEQIADEGYIRIGVDLIRYLSVNVTTIVGGVYDGFVREATFILDSTPPHDYGDDPDFNDDFSRDPVTLALRIDHFADDTIVDAVATAGVVAVNDSGIIDMGTEEVEYESVTIIGDRYVFQLATGYQTPDTTFEKLSYSHVQDAEITVHRHDTGRWTQSRTGLSRIIGQGDARFVIDQLPVPQVSTAALVGQYTLRDNVDFDVSVAMSFDTWTDPLNALQPKRALARLHIGSKTYDLGIETTRQPTAAITHAITAHTTEVELEEVVDCELRLKRVGSTLEFQYRSLDSQTFQVILYETVSGARATLDLVVEDDDSGAPSQVTFDEVVRRVGDIVGQTRLEEEFSATALYPYTYDIDQRVTEATELRDRPRVRSESLVTIDEIDTDDPGTIRAQGQGDEFEAAGVPEAGVLTLSGTQILYDDVDVESGIFTFQLRGKVDPDIVPLAVGAAATATTRVIADDTDYLLSGDGQISLVELPTRDRMWAPVAKIDEQHVQATFGQLVDLGSDMSTDTYLSRVQGTWFALMSGAAFQNVHSGLQLAMGLPVAQITGTVTGFREYYDDLGRLVRRVCIIRGEDGVFEHTLNPDLYPHIDWTVIIGQNVDRFEPLSNGIEVLDVVADPVWHDRFPGVADIERFNTFGIFVAIEALSSEASTEDAVRFALRIKPTYTKMVMRFLLTSGDEDLSDELDDTLGITLLPHVCEDMTFDEGDVPEDPEQILRLGEGHKLGQGKRLGGTGQWHARTLGTYVRQGPFGDGQIGAGGDIFTGPGGFSKVEAQYTDDGSTSDGGEIFVSTGHVFTAFDVGKSVTVLDATLPEDIGDWVITNFIAGDQVRVAHAFGTTEGNLDWQLRTSIFVDTDLAKNVHVNDATDPADNDDHKISEIVSDTQVRVLHTFGTSESDRNWELRDYMKLGEDFQLGDYVAYRCHAPSDNVPSSIADYEQIVTVAFSP